MGSALEPGQVRLGLASELALEESRLRVQREQLGPGLHPLNLQASRLLVFFRIYMQKMRTIP